MIDLKKNPLVSVIMPAYNAERYIGEAIVSVLQQTYENLELIIIEDCSTDATLQEIEKIRDPRIRLLKNVQNLGIAETTNRGLDISRGKYIALLDDDDIAMPERLKLQVEYLEEHEDIDILGGRSIVIDKEGNIVNYCSMTRYNPLFIKAVLLFNCIDFNNGTSMIRRDFIIKNYLRYENHCYGMQDYKFLIESSKIGKISSIDAFLLKKRLHDRNETVIRKLESQKERADTYAKFQEYSLKKSGYFLEKKHMDIIRKALAEDGGKCENFEEITLLYEAFGDILKQAASMKVNYYLELNILCRIKFAEQLSKMDLWNETGRESLRKQMGVLVKEDTYSEDRNEVEEQRA